MFISVAYDIILVILKNKANNYFFIVIHMNEP